MPAGHQPYGVYEKYVKRPLDCALAGGLLLLLSPLCLLIALLVRLKPGAPVLYRVQRPGRDGRIFELKKFRTMSEKRDAQGRLLPDEARLTSFGRFLRASSLDELPELWNIVKGEMALVGPRPLAAVYLDYYTEEELHRHDVRPGLTGLAQVNGRNSLSWEEKFAYDLAYVRRITWIGDVKICIKTVSQVLRRKDIGQGAAQPVSLHIERANRKRKTVA